MSIESRENPQTFLLENLSKLEGKQKRRFFEIFGASVNTTEGAYGYGASDEDAFYNKYPNFESFKSFALEYLGKIERTNGQQKREEYHTVMSEFVKLAFDVETNPEEFKE